MSRQRNRPTGISTHPRAFVTMAHLVQYPVEDAPNHWPLIGQQQTLWLGAYETLCIVLPVGPDFEDYNEGSMRIVPGDWLSKTWAIDDTPGYTPFVPGGKCQGWGHTGDVQWRDASLDRGGCPAEEADGYLYWNITMSTPGDAGSFKLQSSMGKTENEDSPGRLR